MLLWWLRLIAVYFFTWEPAQKYQMVIVRVGFEEGHASSYDKRHAQLSISNRDILTFGILSGAAFFSPFFLK